MWNAERARVPSRRYSASRSQVRERRRQEAQVMVLEVPDVAVDPLGRGPDRPLGASANGCQAAPAFALWLRSILGC
jgi:hypothetical protein